MCKSSLLRYLSGTLLLLLTSACRAPSTLAPHGEAAAEIGQLSWLLFGLGTVVYVGVCAFLLVALFRRKRSHTDVGFDAAPQPESEGGGRSIIFWGGLVMPTVVLLVVFGLTLNTLMALSAGDGTDEVVIDVIGHQWWWKVVYPAANVVTANEIYVPVGQPVRINLTAMGVIHSFWVPQLHGKLDMIPGHTNTFRIEADEPGEYRGICAEFCGIQHARMLFLVIAVPPDEFAAWLAAQTALANEPTTASAQMGRDVFFDAACDECHAIAGTEAAGQLGPDLTHFASRREIAAGTLANNRGNLAGWLVGPQELKPGNLMPTTALSGPELQALLDYIETLR